MQDEKNFLVSEVGSYLDRSDYVILTDFTGLTVAETEDLRIKLEAKQAEFHVVKNRIFERAASQRDYPEMNGMLKGHTGLIFGGQDIPGVIKLLEKFQETTKKLATKGAVLSKSLVPADKVPDLKDLPAPEVVKAQFLGLLQQSAQTLVTLLQTPAQEFVGVIGAPARDILNILSQREMKLKQEGEAA